MEGGETEGGGHGRPGAMPWLSVKEGGRRVCRACATAKLRCAMAGGDTIKVSQKKMEDVEEGSSGGKKRKRKEEEEIKAEFGLVVEELWGQVVRRWEESEQRQEQR